ncbi:hypothetical protein [Penaeicola halotolerans]|uniref:hypothetical protein n=1 Tax=Penaeicola halotolerans TaxID=2793196 RepID=UPI001CF87C09|nr:hypothetical protein [Penaeicola halotolerans]
MKNFHPFFIIGTVGMIINAALHIFMTLGLSIDSNTIFLGIYPTFLLFIVLGVALTLKKQKESGGTEVKL